MGFQSQEPVFVQRARQVASLHMAYQLNCGRYGRGFWAFGAQPQPLSVQSPEPSEQDWHGRTITAVCVTLRYPERWQVRVYMERTGNGRECWQWKVLRLDSIFPNGSETGESRREGKALYDALVESYCMTMSDLACTFITRVIGATTADGRMDILCYRMTNGEEVSHKVFYDRVNGGLRCRLPTPAHLNTSPIYEP